MDNRRRKILEAVIKEYTKLGLPVGSGALVDKYDLGVSSATVRNVMSELEEDGYIIQPHTSAGRVPTEKAYRFFVSGLEKTRLAESIKKSFGFFDGRLKDSDLEGEYKKVAKLLSELSGNAVFWAFHKNSIYYTGISNLFQQPEFSQISSVQNISFVIDKIDEVISEIFDNVSSDPRIFIGDDNPFGDLCGTVMVKYKVGNSVGIFGVIGPIRMDYGRNLALINLIRDLIVK